MNNRFVLVVLTVALLTTTGCGQMRNFLFGRGARCGLCNRFDFPKRLQPAAVPAAPTCNTPTYFQPRWRAQDSCGCNVQPQCQTGCAPTDPCDPYGYGVVGSGTLEGNGWYPAPLNNQGYRSNYPDGLDYRVDEDGARIIHEDPLPPNAQAVN